MGSGAVPHEVDGGGVATMLESVSAGPGQHSSNIGDHFLDAAFGIEGL